MGGAIGGIAGSVLGGPVGGVLGSLGGSALGGLVGGGGGGGGGGFTGGQNPAVYVPGGQQQQDFESQGLMNQLGWLGWGNLNAMPGGVTPASQIYPQIAGIAQQQAAPGSVPGSYGPYGDVALQGSLGALTGYESQLGSPYNLVNYSNLLGGAGLSALPQVQQAAFNPSIGQAVSNIIDNPYYSQQLTGAQQGAGIGQQEAGLAQGQIGVLDALGGNLPGLGQQAAATTQSQIPLLQQLAGGSAGQGAQLAGQAQGLLPQLQQLYGQTVPGLLQAGGQYAAQAGATTPQLQAIGQSGAGLAGAAPGLAQQAAATSAGLPAAQQQILQTGMDPQNALFNQLSQQTRDQANAMNAMSGLAGTPYAAGLTNQATQNFDINWQNQQLQRQATAAQAAGGLANQQLAGITGGANILGGLTQQGGQLGISAANQQLQNALGGGNLYGNLVGQAGLLGGNLAQGQLGALTGAGNLYNQGALGAGTLAGQAGNLSNLGLNQQLAAAQGAGNLFQGALGLGQGGTQLAAQAGALPAGAYTQQQQNALQALAAQSQLAGQGVNNLSNLTNLLGAAGQQGITAQQALANFTAGPYNAAQTQGQNAFNALQNQANYANQLLNLPESVIQNALAYLGRGQSAAQVSGQLGQQAFNQNQQQLAGLGGLLSGGSNLLFGNQGLAGALGGNSQTGLLGLIQSLTGGGGSGGPGSFLIPGTDTSLVGDAFSVIPSF